MKAYLMHRNRDFDLQQPFPPNKQDLVDDLELETLFKVMAQGDKFVLEIVRKAVLCGLDDPDAIRYRQDILKDCLNNPEIIRAIYQIPLDSAEIKRRRWMGIFTHSPGGVLSSSTELMIMFVDLLRKLKSITTVNASRFVSEGFTTFIKMIDEELDDEYFETLEFHLNQLKFRDGVLISAELGDGCEATNYTLRLPNGKNRNWLKEIITRKPSVYSFVISERDIAGSRALADIKDKGINLAANALAQSATHIDNFFNMLQTEIAFYIGCINLSESLNDLENPITFPIPIKSSYRKHAFKGLYDVCLALTMKKKIVGNDLNLDGKNLTLITGANQGGKSTFLRSIGLAQMMMQSGMFVPAIEFQANISDGIFTHYRRKEDPTMKSGKLDEELERMNTIVESISPNSLILLNESFAATNEREGSEIARQITSALLDREIKIFYVTHMHEFADIFYRKQRDDIIFLRAERKSSGRRTFKLIEAEPLQTSFGEDIYKIVFEGKIQK